MCIRDRANTITIGDASATGVSITDNNWSVTTAGAATFVGVNSGSGLIQGTGGLTVTGAIQFSTLTSNGPLYTSAGNGTLTTTAPTSGAIAVSYTHLSL